MATPDDISDMFDDDLTRSIVEGQKGPWGADQPQFVDPALKALEEELAGTKRRDYRQRRIEELKQREESAAEAKPRAVKRPAAPPATAPAADAPPRTPWGAGDFKEAADALLAEPAPATAAAASAAATPASGGDPAADQDTPNAPGSRLAPFGIAIANAMFVIAAATAAHALLTGWSALLLGRGLVVGVSTGVLWQALRTGRLRATAIAACAYTAGFLPSDQIGRIEHILALFLGLFAVVAGAALLGDRSRRF